VGETVTELELVYRRLAHRLDGVRLQPWATWQRLAKLIGERQATIDAANAVLRGPLEAPSRQ
jgi:hypothetical protein